LREAGHGDWQGVQEIREIVGSRLSLYVGAQREDDLGGCFGFDAFDEGVDAEVFRADVVERRDATAQGVIEAAESACSFER
jgi:hypothetical protein